MENYYMTAVQLTLGVRSIKPNVLCQIEIGMPGVVATHVMEKRSKFIKKFVFNSTCDEPLSQIIGICEIADNQGLRVSKTTSRQ